MNPMLSHSESLLETCDFRQLIERHLKLLNSKERNNVYFSSEFRLVIVGISVKQTLPVSHKLLKMQKNNHDYPFYFRVFNTGSSLARQAVDTINNQESVVTVLEEAKANPIMGKKSCIDTIHSTCQKLIKIKLKFMHNLFHPTVF